MPTFSSNAPFNPNPISKILVVFLTGLTVMHGINIRFELAIVCLIGILFYLNGYKKTLFKWIILCIALYSLPNFMILTTLNPILKMFLSIPIVFRMFLLPFMAASFMIKTSDVGTHGCWCGNCCYHINLVAHKGKEPITSVRVRHNR